MAATIDRGTPRRPPEHLQVPRDGRLGATAGFADHVMIAFAQAARARITEVVRGRTRASSAASRAFSDPSSSPPAIRITAAPLPSRSYAMVVPSFDFTALIGSWSGRTAVDQ